MHVIIASLGTAGDVYPFIGIGIALRNRGHKVTILTNSLFEKTVRSAKLDFYAVSSPEELEKGMSVVGIGTKFKLSAYHISAENIWSRPTKPT